MLVTKKNLITTLSAGALVLGFATEAAASIQPDLQTAPGARNVRMLTPEGRHVAKLRREARQSKTASPESYGVSQSTLDAIASCESGGDPTAVSSDGTYRGKYQFDYGTWASVGGSGDPAAAPEAEQDMRAAMLLSEAGTSPWPVCG